MLELIFLKTLLDSSSAYLKKIERRKMELMICIVIKSSL